MKATGKLFAIALCAPIWIIALAVGHALAVENWGGPTYGPPRQASTVTFISQDLRNGGITAAYRGFYTASLELGWTVHLVDGKNDTATIRAGIVDAVRAHSNAIVLGGFDDEAFSDVIVAAQRAKSRLPVGTPPPNPDRRKIYLSILQPLRSTSPKPLQTMQSAMRAPQKSAW